MQLKKYTQKDRHGNMMSYEFEVPPMNEVPKPETSFPGGPKGTDTVPAWLTPGENVVNAEASRLYQPLLDQMNNVGRSIQAQQGGPIPDYLAGGAEVDGEVNYNPLAWITPEVLDNLRQTESGGKHLDDAGNLIKSPSGAIGAYQWLPKSAANAGYGVQPFDITSEEEQRKATQDYLVGIQQANPNFTPEQVLQSYNAGPTRMREFVAGKGKPLTNETIQYPGKVLADVDRSQWGARAIPVSYKGNPSNQIDQLTYDVPELDGTIPPTVTESNIMPELTDVSPGHAMFNNKIDQLTYDVPELDGTTISYVASNEVPGFEGQDTSKMSPIRLAAYNKALAMMNNNGMPVATTETINRANPDINVVPTSGYNENLPGSDNYYEVPELDGVVPIPVRKDKTRETENFSNAEDVGLSTEGEVSTWNTGNAYNAAIDDEKIKTQKLKEAIIDGRVTATLVKQAKEAQANLIKTAGDNEKALKNQEEFSVAEAKKNESLLAEAKRIAGITSGEIKNTKALVKEDQKNKVINKIINDNNVAQDQTATGHTEENAKIALQNQNKIKTNKDVNESKGFFAELFGDLIDTKELARMAVMYAGSRALGGSHEGSLGFAAKNYINRIDTKAANREKTAIALIAKGKHTTASIAAYKKSGNEGDLILIGVPINSTGNRKYWYDPVSKRRVLASEFKQGDKTFWSADKGKSPIPEAYVDNGKEVPNSTEYNAYMNTLRPQMKSVLDEIYKRADKSSTGSTDKGTYVASYKTNIKPSVASDEVAAWAIKNKMDVTRMSPLVEQAYEMAIAQSGGNTNKKPSSLLPYLNSLKLREDTGVPALFNTGKPSDPKPMDADKIELLSKRWLAMNNLAGAPVSGTHATKDGKVGRNRDIVNNFWNQAAELWKNKTQEERDLYADSAQEGKESAFYVYAKEQMNLPMK
jgi:hypothetical protein